MEKQFVGLLNQNRVVLYKICKMYCPDAEDRRDLFQEIVFQLWKAFPTFRQESNVNTWVYRVGMNTAISNFRKEKKRQSPAGFALPDIAFPDFYENDNSNSETVLLYQAIEQLSAVEKAIVLLYLDEKSYDEMAGILGISKSNVGVKLSRIKIKLEKIVKSLTF
ncbi:ECF RNA polymerase sigma factor SigG [Dyadobacter sp. CECT 9623]|uniref:ECF RNA polymerase sigma factor SigG n=1 Tax=Dyadobacter linearis TaxID=2823330 RepID=A0ABN7R3Z4_9BACT|nr:sigma-70 family RNA polymerase sigma factor [Dyadobacter sp. CECT 9623]CAG5068094.1 ECF RNA polymerase sigma factor SigG [Dyadobacter sp. CECT 9623]